MGKVIVLACSDTEDHILSRIMAVLEDEQVIEYVPISSVSVLSFPGLEINSKEQTVYCNGEPVSMSHHEFFTLHYLAQHPNWVFSKEQIYEAVWKESGDGGAAVVNIISQIRRKIGNRYIKTIIGSGYKFEV